MDKINSYGQYREIVLYSKVKLLRNVENLPFCNRMTQEQKVIFKNIITQIYNHNEYLSKYLTMLDMESISDKIKIISRQILSDSFDISNKLVFTTTQNDVSICVNDIEHLTIQAKCLGLNLDKAYQICNDIDDIFDNSLYYAFDNKLGYLTTSPYDLGTALRVCVILHLPALEQSGIMNRLSSTIERMGLRITSVFDNVENNSAMYKISNRLTLGITEIESIQNLNSIVKQIIDSEILARNNLIQNRLQIEDDIFRSLGILKYARAMSISEFLNLYSKVRLGIATSIIKDINLDKIDKLLNKINNNNICNTLNDKLSVSEMDCIRAKIVRQSLNE